MTYSNITQEHVKLLNELASIANSDSLKTSSIQALKSVYLKMNLSYISLCEKYSNLPYMPSSKSDMLFARYTDSGDKTNARKIVEQRMSDIITYIERA